MLYAQLNFLSLYLRVIFGFHGCLSTSWVLERNASLSSWPILFVPDDFARVGMEFFENVFQVVLCYLIM